MDYSKKIPYTVPYIPKDSINIINKVIKSGKVSGNGIYTKECHKWFEDNLRCKKALLTTSCTSAIELAALVLDIKRDDEIILPSFSFPSVASVFVMLGCKLVFADIRLDTLCIDEDKIEDLITDKTKAILVIHYAGNMCNMEKIMNIADKYNIYVIEDSAQSLLSSCTINKEEKYAGTIGDLGVISFHGTKNITCGEGGVLLINNEKFIERSEIIWEKGTNRKEFLAGKVDKYSWVDVGLSFYPSEILSCMLYSGLLEAKHVTNNRYNTWKLYKKLIDEREFTAILPNPIYNNKHSAHIFYLLLENRNYILHELKNKNIEATSHFEPLHTSKFGSTFYRMLPETTFASNSIVRLPLWYNIENEEVEYIISSLKELLKR